MVRKSYFCLFLLCVIFKSATTKSNISVILHHCTDFPECSESTIDQSSQNYHKSLVKLLSSGVNQFLWEHVGNENEFNESISSACEKSLKYVWKSVTSGEEWAFKRKFQANHKTYHSC